ncbi:putative Zn finger-like uncharacterized protein [Paucimonas lemoignei]|uniref:Putative Zn finger-like uncharacterized protein n=1 Tax=Paucimonas lemoignei TaxID=29443 RepID=A0A4R3HWC8_PAULE|nr:DUF3426 domain-containing protein [Paucimonas lemoignei]TCS36883.1 putative Zn finger-like uncharacterized protein [Paucimonas lemoignei]
MALATQCPHCHTTFRVAHDQLKLRSGLVRCGACKQIFNGIENLVAPDQASPSAPPSAPVKPSVAPAAPSPAAPVKPDSSLASSAVSNAVTAISQEEAEPAETPKPQPSERSAINTLEFVPVDDPETQTRILASESNPGQAPAREQIAATEPQAIDDDPLTRMTLVDFSLFEEDIEKEAEPEISEVPPASPPSTQEIWPNTTELVEAESAEPHVDIEPATPVEQDAADASAPEPVTEPIPAAEPEPALAIDAQPLPVAEEPVEDDTVPNTRVDATTAIMADTTPPQDIDTVAPVTAGVALPASATTEEIQPQEYSESEIEESSAATEDEEPSFVTSERRRQRRRRAMHIFMAVASILLFAAVLFQAAYVFRNQLAVRFPQTRPLLSQLCNVAGCQVQLPAQIDQVSIESNELQMAAANKNVFMLSLLLHNRSSLPQSWPYIELTLNDKEGKALVRRVLTPKEYLPADKKLADGIAARSEQAVNVSFELNQLQASDYRVYLFYP